MDSSQNEKDAINAAGSEIYYVDGVRWDHCREFPVTSPSTGILVRALFPDERGAPDRVGNADIAWLTKVSLLAWLRSRGGDNGLAERTVAILLGHVTILKVTQ